ncbi:glyoxylate reductase/hydroxypyruvate reductase isoform X3 [Bradysia coprophila]|nr:glyoxylate reductase/hydroxypyruvate reductase isoform X3 [Bradysia coprophila]XP_037042353.1 glyoxylate reductase/hydroxypyruvate reductase isoform X3 [Bradysia coprophila]
MKPRVYLTRPDVAQVGIDLIQDECELTTWFDESPVPREELLRNVAGKDALFCTLTDKIDAEVLDQAGPNLKVVATMSVGYEHIDITECKKRGIRVGYTPDCLTDATAELTIALLLATTRRLIEANEEVHTGGWSSWSPGWMCGQSIKNSTVGIVGFGRIGQEVAKRIVPFRPKRLLFSNRSERPEEAKQIGAEQCTFDELLHNSDFVILTCAATPDTFHLINAASLGKMKTNAVLINTSRGTLVNQTDLYDFLKTERIRAAGLDVTTPEPLPLDSPLLTLQNCIVLPHIGSADVDTRKEMSRITACNILAGLKGVKMIAEL